MKNLSPIQIPGIAASFVPRQLIEWYHTRRYDELTNAFLEILTCLEQTSLIAAAPEVEYFVDVFAENFFYFFCQEDFPIVGETVTQRFIDLNPLIANLTAISRFRTTDAFVQILLRQSGNFVKILALYNPHNTLRLDRKVFFDTHPGYASRWDFAFTASFVTAASSKNSYDHLREHIRYADDRLSVGSPHVNAAYFGCTYLDPERDREFKASINRAVQRDCGQRRITNRPDRRKIAIFTAMWYPAHSVHRCQHPLVSALAGSYDLTLIHLGAARPDLDTTGFADVRHYEIRRMGSDFSAFDPNEFIAAYFPDIGMSNESVFLSNLRIAPIQISSYGHPVSTSGSQIDYWIGGQETEVAALAQKHYSERLVLMPGTGLLPTFPRYTRTGTQPPASPIVINCPWYQQKINYPLLMLLKEVQRRSDRAIKFRFFPGPGVKNVLLPLARFISEVLGPENIEVFPFLEYDAFMRTMEEGHFTIDSYPFGGYTTIVDSLYLRKPVVTRRGDRFYNLVPSVFLHRVGLDELVADSDEAFVALITRLITDEAFRGDMTQRVRDADVKALIFDRSTNIYFKQAVDFLVEHHDELQADPSHAPISIPLVT